VVLVVSMWHVESPTHSPTKHRPQQTLCAFVSLLNFALERSATDDIRMAGKLLFDLQYATFYTPYLGRVNVYCF